MKKAEVNKLANKVVYLVRNEKDIRKAIALFILPPAELRKIGDAAVRILNTNKGVWADAVTIFEATKAVVEAEGMSASEIGLELFAEYALGEDLPEYADIYSEDEEDYPGDYEIAEAMYSVFWEEINRLLNMQ